jgi:hypothetical protein
MLPGTCDGQPPPGERKFRAPAPMREFVCTYCADTFKARKSNARFCTDICRLRWTRARDRRTARPGAKATQRATTAKAPIARTAKTDANGTPDQHFSEPKTGVSDPRWPSPEWARFPEPCDCRICTFNRAHPGATRVVW